MLFQWIQAHYFSKFETTTSLHPTTLEQCIAFCKLPSPGKFIILLINPVKLNRISTFKHLYSQPFSVYKYSSRILSPHTLPTPSQPEASNSQKMLVLLLTIFAVSVTAGPTPGTRHQAIVDIAEDSGAYRGKIHVNGELYDLNLEQTDEESVFAPSFRLTETITDSFGQVSFRDVTPSEGVRDLERSIFVDKKTNSVFRILNENGKIQLHGLMNKIHVSNDGEDHFAVFHDISRNSFASDVVRTNFTSTPDDSLDARAITVANPELYVTIDYKQWTNLGQSEARVLEYMAIMIRAVNSVYSLMEDPQIKFKIVGSAILKARSQQPFIEKNRIDSKSFNQGETLWDFGQYMYSIRAKIPKHDLAPLLSGEFYPDSAGVAQLAGACKDDANVNLGGSVVKMNLQISISSDQYGEFVVGVHTLTHELAHSLGSPHDANYDGVEPGYDTGDCPWETGYIMTYKWRTENQFLFSKCSKRSMKKYLSTIEAKCVREYNAPGKARPPATKNPGALVSMDRQCAVLVPLRITGGICADLSAKAAWDEKTPDELCSRLTCICEGYETIELTERVLEGTPCRKDGTGACKFGKCV